MLNWNNGDENINDMGYRGYYWRMEDSVKESVERLISQNHRWRRWDTTSIVIGKTKKYEALTGGNLRGTFYTDGFYFLNNVWSEGISLEWKDKVEVVWGRRVDTSFLPSSGKYALTNNIIPLSLPTSQISASSQWHRAPATLIFFLRFLSVLGQDIFPSNSELWKTGLSPKE